MKKLQPIFNGKRPPGIYRLGSRAKAPSVMEALQSEGWRGFHLDGDDIKDKKTFLTACDAALEFPGYFGGNWDAFEECINDLDWITPAKGYVLLYDQVARFARKDPDEWRMAYNILQESVERWQNTKTPMYVLFRNTWWYVRGLEKL